ncbi:hypothetical protein BDF21DRAFT_452394 [Thamnidium elegans]|uniref:Uncharacterized protein n=1 Tax=Thamnidium elegans TaxID=101142 RepID=A0A8H7SL79_9FUNG|nr:hypothetical protein INT48_008767 [Thamnidium elegans]KAI8079158.1 hypothetical protein BDF21DRAFT_452394 [Thamnidium elegans]
MKFSIVSIAALATVAATVSATLTINEPWGETTWTSGGNGSVTWNSTAEEVGKLCEIHLLTGEATAATFVANLTSNGNLVPCNYTRVNFNHLPDYAAGDYFVRLGENGGSMDLYSYSGYFKYIGNGTVTVEAPATNATAATDPTVDAVTQPAAPVDSAPATI